MIKLLPILILLGCASVPQTKVVQVQPDYVKKESRKLQCLITLVKYDVDPVLAAEFCSKIVDNK